MRRWVILGAIVIVSGCTTLLGFDKNYTLGDASPDESSTTDVGQSDVQPADGASGDVAVDGPALRQCQILMAGDAAPIFCDDFDDGKPLSSKWTQVYVQAPWSLGVVSDASVSAPASLLGFADVDANLQAALHEDFASLVTTYVAVEADLRLDKFSGDASTQVYAICPLEIGLSDPNTPLWRARLDVYSDHAELEELEAQPDGGFGFDFNPLTAHLNVGQWTHVRIQVDLTSHTITVTFDGNLVYKRVSKYAWSPGYPPYASAGMLFARWGLAGPWRFHVDNVAVYGE